MYDMVTELVGPIPTEFTFIYVILTLVISLLVISFLFQLLYLPINLLRK